VLATVQLVGNCLGSIMSFSRFLAASNAVRVLAAAAAIVLACSPGDQGAGEQPNEPVAVQRAALVTCDLSAPFGPVEPAFTGVTIANGITFSQDGRTAYVSAKLGTSWNYDVYVATRTSAEVEFGAFLTTVSSLSSGVDDRVGSLSPDGSKFFLAKIGTSGKYDLAAATFNTTTGQFDPPQLLSALNTPLHEQDPFFLPINGGQLYFSAETPPSEIRELYVSPASNGYSTKEMLFSHPAEDLRPVLTTDAQRLYFTSTRATIARDGEGDIWSMTRNPATGAFDDPIDPIDLYVFSSPKADYPVALADGGCTLYIASNRNTRNEADYQLFKATRGSSTPANVTTTVRILGTGSITTAPFVCSTNCSAQGAPGSQYRIFGTSQALWGGACIPDGNNASSDGFVIFSQGGVCTVDFRGVCGSGRNIPRDDDNPCTTDTCDPAQGVFHEPLPGTACTTSAGTPGTCSAFGVCVNGVGAVCAVTADCTGGLVCSGGACAEPCTDNTDCPGGAECFNGTCGPPGGPCTLDSQCRQPDVHCSPSGTCGGPDAVCGSSTGCKPGLECIDGTCQCPANAACSALCPCGPDGVCTENNQCGAGLECQDGHCSPVGDGESGDSCDDDVDCAAGFVCGNNNGACFTDAGSQRVCWPLTCEAGSILGQCGESDSPCGQNCACVNWCNTLDPNNNCSFPERPCATVEDCEAGEACTPGNGWFFGVGEVAVCWPGICATEARAQHCGGVDSPCGICDCTANCSGKTCGSDMSNGCGGECTGICGDGEGGCVSDAHCPAGSVCIEGGGPRVGLGPEINVCLPAICDDFDLSRVPCGSSASLCGECPMCAPDCVGKCAGAADGCGGTCTSSCATGQVCGSSGFCLGDYVPVDVVIPDGLGGTRSVTPLDAGPTSGVGATPGHFGVTDTGKATYRIPIAVAPGRLGIEPGLSLSYGGTRRNGFLGVGWNLEGLSGIARCKRTEPADGFSAPIAEDITDRYCLDGVRLIAHTNEEYGADGTTYYPEFDPRTRVKSFGTSGAGPVFFKVWRSNALIYTYGSTPDASVYSTSMAIGTKREWALNRMEDRVGNYLTIEYMNDGSRDNPFIQTLFPGTREIVPVLIKYTGFDGPGAPPLEPNRAIHLRYESRPDANYSYAYNGHAVHRSRRLQTITSSLGSNAVRVYNIDYGDEVGQPAQNGLSRVAKVTECVGNACKQPTVFEYFDDAGRLLNAPVSTGVRFQGDSINTKYGIPASPEALQRTDFNGDGRDDVFYTYYDTIGEPDRTDPITRWGWLEGKPFGTAPGVASHEFDPTGPIGRYASWESELLADCDGFAPPIEQAALGLLGDWDLDGKDDLLDYWVHHRTSIRWLRANSFQPQALPVPSFVECLEGVVGNSGRQRAADLRIADFTGDGKPDIVSCNVDMASEEERDALLFYPGISTQLFGSPIALGLDGHRFCSASKASVEDVDGDGTVELLRESIRDFSGHKRVMRFRGTTPMGWSDWLAPGTSGNRDHPTRISSLEVDLNGDGWRDHVEVHRAPADQVRVWINKGTGYYETPAGALELSGEALSAAFVADLNLDGQQEIVVPLIARIGHSSEIQAANTWRVITLRPSGLVELGTINSGAWTIFLDLTPAFRFSWPTKTPTLVADLDGNGSDDVLFVDQGQEAVIARGIDPRTNLLKSVTDGAGKHVYVDYSHAAYTPGSECAPLACERRVSPILVSYHSVAQVLGSGFEPKTELIVQYTYEDARRAPATKELLGFARRTIAEFDGTGFTSEDALRTTSIEFDNSTKFFGGYPLAGKRKKVRVTEPYASSSTGWSFIRSAETEYFWDIALKGPASIVSPILRGKEVRHTEFVDSVQFPGTIADDREILTVGEEYTLDNFNNVSGVWRTESTGELIRSTTTSTVFYDRSSDWLISLPWQSTVQDSVHRRGLPDLSETRTSSWDFYPSGMLKQFIREPGSAYYRLQRDSLRDPYGNEEIAIETSAENPQTGEAQVRLTTTVFDAEKIFPTTVFDGMSQPTYVDFDRRFGTPTLVADANGITNQAAYDAFGRKTREVGPGTESIVSYESAALTQSEMLPVRAVMKATVETSGQGIAETFVDSFGRQVATAVTGLKGETVLTETEYDDAGRLWKQSRPHLAGVQSQGIVTREYRANRLWRITMPNTSTIELEYASRATVQEQPANHVWFVSTKNPNGFTSLAVTGSRGEMVRTWDTGDHSLVDVVPGPFGTVVSSTVSSTAAGDTTTTYEFDKYGRVVLVDDPDRGVERFLYTAWNETDRVFFGSSTTPARVFDYDLAGRLTSISAPSEPLPTTFVYGSVPQRNELGRLVSMTSHDGSRREFGYEAPRAVENRGFLTTVTDTVDGHSLVTESSYNGFGQLETVTYPGSSTPLTVEYRYDTGGNVEAVGSPDFTETYWELVDTDQGIRPSLERVGAMTTQKDYFGSTGKLRMLATFPPVGSAVQEAYHYYDANGNLTQRVSYEAEGAVIESFVPDALDRLTSVTSNGVQTFSAAYSPNGNVTGLTTVPGPITYDNPGARPAHAPRSTGDANFTYDARGNRETATGPGVIGGSQTSSYNVSGQVTGIDFTSGGVARVDYDYQASGERSRRRLSTGAQTLYSGGYERRVAADGTVEQSYRIASPSGVVVEVTRDAQDQELSRAYLHPDRMGSPQVLTNSNGQVLHRQKFGPFGAVTNPSWLSSNPAARRVLTGYTGHQHDPETGLVNMGARLYDAGIARFTGPDLFVQLPSWTQAYNRYAYAWNNPYGWVDPSGLQNENFSVYNEGSNSQTTRVDGDETQDFYSPLTVKAGAYTPDVRMSVAPLESPAVPADSMGEFQPYASNGPEALSSPSPVIPYFWPAGNTPAAPEPSRLSIDDMHVILNTASVAADISGVGTTVGWVFDIASGGLSRLQGDEAGVQLSAAAALPVVGVGANAAKAARAGHNGVQGPAQQVARTTRNGDKAVRQIFPDGSVKDISPSRVKESVPSNHPNAPPGVRQKVKFGDAQAGSKGIKRDPTPVELEVLQ
jgi:RHS repeat-associated protein